MPEQAVYMALLGGYEELLEQPIATESSVPFICLTDDAELTSDTWQIQVVDRAFAGDLVRSARKLKILGHPSLEQYDETLWIDNTVLLKTPPEQILADWLKDHDIAAPRHSYRASVIAEVEAVIDAGRDEPARLYEQLLTYLRQCPDVMHQKPYWTGMLARRSTPQVRAAMATWWDHVARYSRRDQISFPVAVDSLSVNALDLDNKISDIHRWPRALNRVTPESKPAVNVLRPDVSEIGRLQNEIDALTFDSIGAINQREHQISQLRGQLDEESELRREAAALQMHAASLQRQLDAERRRQVEMDAQLIRLGDELKRARSSLLTRLSEHLRAPRLPG